MRSAPRLAAWEVRADEFPDHGEAREELAFLLRYAVLAPSGHNTQPWLFALDGDTVELYADRTQALPAVDPEDRALTISCGAALLNLRVALRRFGYRDDTFELLPAPTRPDLLARVRLVAGEPPSREEEALFEAIPARRTTRAVYDERELPAELQTSLVREAIREGAWLHLVPDGQRGVVAGLIAEGDRLQMADRRFRHELAAWMHPNRSRAPRGMPGYGFGFGNLASVGTPLVIGTVDLGKRQAVQDHDLALHSAVLAVLGTDADGPPEWLAAGQALERVLLRACSHGFTASFLNQPVEVEPLRPRLAAAMGRPDAFPQLVLRLGDGPEIPHTPRETVENVLVRPAHG